MVPNPHYKSLRIPEIGIGVNTELTIGLFKPVVPVDLFGTISVHVVTKCRHVFSYLWQTVQWQVVPTVPVRLHGIMCPYACAILCHTIPRSCFFVFL